MASWAFAVCTAMLLALFPLLLLLSLPQRHKTFQCAGGRSGWGWRCSRSCSGGCRGRCCGTCGRFGRCAVGVAHHALHDPHDLCPLCLQWKREKRGGEVGVLVGLICMHRSADRKANLSRFELSLQRGFHGQQCLWRGVRETAGLAMSSEYPIECYPQHPLRTLRSAASSASCASVLRCARPALWRGASGGFTTDQAPAFPTRLRAVLTAAGAE